VRRGLRRVEDLTPGSRVQSRGDSDTLALPAGTKSVQEPEATQCDRQTDRQTVRGIPISTLSTADAR